MHKWNQSTSRFTSNFVSRHSESMAEGIAREKLEQREQIKAEIAAGTLHPDARNRSGWSLLMLAAYKNDFELVKYLLDEQYASTYYTSPNNCTVVSVAAANGNLDILLYVLAGVDLDTIASLEVLNNLPYLLKQDLLFARVYKTGCRDCRVLEYLNDLLSVFKTTLAGYHQVLAFVRGKTYLDLLCDGNRIKHPDTLRYEIEESITEELGPELEAKPLGSGALAAPGSPAVPHNAASAEQAEKPMFQMDP